MRRMTERRAKLERGRLHRRQTNMARTEQGFRSTRKSELSNVGGLVFIAGQASLL